MRARFVARRGLLAKDGVLVRLARRSRTLRPPVWTTTADLQKRILRSSTDLRFDSERRRPKWGRPSQSLLPGLTSSVLRCLPACSVALVAKALDNAGDGDVNFPWPRGRQRGSWRAQLEATNSAASHVNVGITLEPSRRLAQYGCPPRGPASDAGGAQAVSTSRQQRTARAASEQSRIKPGS